MPARHPTPLTRAVTAACAGLIALALTAGCAPEPSVPAATTPTATPAPEVTPPPIAAFPFGQAASTTPLPQDCESILTEEILDSLEGIPLNAPGMGGGIRPDSSRVCVWAHPGAAMTRLVTIVGYAPYNPAMDALNALSTDDGYLCYRPDEGVRCEKAWTDEVLGLPEGRTLYYRDGVLVDTQYANLAPRGYTTAVIQALWPAG